MRVFAIILMSILLSGCLYPNERLSSNQATNDEELRRVQAAVEEYQSSNNGLLPIKTRDQDTPLFVKYPIEFNTLREQHILGEIPGNAFEAGGYYTYVIVDPENEAVVKVVDARTTERLRSINYEINLYRNETNYAPYGDRIGEDIFEIDEEKMSAISDLTIESPYSGLELDIIMDVNGQALIDFRPDVYQLMEREEIDGYEGDLRFLLTEHYPIAPAYSPEMYLDDNEIILVKES